MSSQQRPEIKRTPQHQSTALCLNSSEGRRRATGNKGGGGRMAKGKWRRVEGVGGGAVKAAEEN